MNMKLWILYKGKRVLPVLAFLFVLFALGRGIWVPLKRRLEQLDRQNAVFKRAIERNRSQSRQFEAQEAWFRKALEMLKQTGSESEMMSSMIFEIETVSHLSEIGLSDMKPNRVKKTASANYFTVSLSIQGTLPQIMRFVFILQSQPHWFEVEQIDMAQQSNSNDCLNCELVLRRVLIF